MFSYKVFGSALKAPEKKSSFFGMNIFLEQLNLNSSLCNNSYLGKKLGCLDNPRLV